MVFNKNHTADDDHNGFINICFRLMGKKGIDKNNRTNEQQKIEENNADEELVKNVGKI